MSGHEAGVTLAQLLDFVREARELVSATTLEQLLGDRVKVRALERVMELVGEAVKRLPPEVKAEVRHMTWGALDPAERRCLPKECVSVH